jgi:NAD-dependent protein deacetylase/lipoamidase
VVCMSCRKLLPLDEISLDTLPPYCSCKGVFKPAGVFFGEPIPLEAMYRSQEAAQSCDLILVIGTSAVVYPAADIPRVAKESGAQVIEINPEKTDLTQQTSDFIIQQKAGVAIPQIIAAIKAMAS